MAIQAALGSDIAMAFDECPPVGRAARRDRGGDGAHHALGPRAVCAAWPRGAPGQLRFGIVQGGLDLGAAPAAPGRDRARCRSTGFALGGLSVGEPPPMMHEVVGAIAPEMPATARAI